MGAGSGATPPCRPELEGQLAWLGWHLESEKLSFNNSVLVQLKIETFRPSQASEEARFYETLRVQI